MSRPTTTPEWDATGNTSTPSPARKTSGWLGATATTPGDKPPAQEFNWFWNLVSTWLSWLSSNGASRVTSYEAATGAVTGIGSDTPEVESDEAFVMQDYDQSLAPFGGVDSVWTTVSIPTVTTAVDVCCDGRAVWVVGDDGVDAYVVQLSRQGATWDAEWQLMAGDNVFAVASSGRHVGVARDDGGTPVAYVWKAANGQELVSARAVSANPIVDIDIIGGGMVVVDDAGAFQLSADMTVAPTVDLWGAPLACCCAWGDYGVVAGDPNGSTTVLGVFELNGGASVWGAGRSGQPVRDVSTDGDLLYVVGEVDGTTSVEAYGLQTGEDVWKRSAVGGDAWRVCHDDRYVYTVEAAGRTSVVVRRKADGHRVHTMTFASAVASIATDGANLYVVEGTDLHVVPTSPLSRVCTRIDPKDGEGVDYLLPNYRKPFAQLILPR